MPVDVEVAVGLVSGGLGVGFESVGLGVGDDAVAFGGVVAVGFGAGDATTGFGAGGSAGVGSTGAAGSAALGGAAAGGGSAATVDVCGKSTAGVELSSAELLPRRRKNVVVSAPIRAKAPTAINTVGGPLDFDGGFACA